MLLNNVLFYMMVTEAGICLVLSLPFGQWLSHAAVSFLVRHLGHKEAVNTIATVVLALVTVLFICTHLTPCLVTYSLQAPVYPNPLLTPFSIGSLVILYNV